MKCRVVLLSVLLSASLQVLAAPAKKESIDELFQLTDSQKMTDAMYAQMDVIYKQAMSTMDIPEDKKAIFEKQQKQLMVAIKEELSWEKLKEPMEKAYASVYTEEDVQGIIAFYKTPAGQNMLKKMPELMKASMTVGQEAMARVMPKIQEMQKQMQDEISKPNSSK